MALFNQLGERVKAFKTKAEALTGGTLERIVGQDTVRIHRQDGRFEEERPSRALRIHDSRPVARRTK